MKEKTAVNIKVFPFRATPRMAAKPSSFLCKK